MVEQSPNSVSASDVLTGIERTLRSHRLYEGTGPQYWEHLDSLGRMLRSHPTDTVFNLSPFGPYLDGEEPPKAQSPVRLWFELFEDGVRQVVIRRTVKKRELDEFLRVLAAHERGQEDIVTRLWRKELPNINTQVVRALVGVCRTPEEASNELRERREYWRSGVMGVSASDETGADSGVALDEEDIRVLATSEHSYDWIRLSRPSASGDNEAMIRPKMAAEIERKLGDFDRFFDMVQVVKDPDATFLSAVLESMAKHGKQHVTQSFCTKLLEQGDEVPASLIARAHEVLAENAGPSLDTDSVDVFEHAPNPELRDSALPDLEIEVDPDEETDESVPVIEEPSDLERLTFQLTSQNPRMACDAVNGLFAMGTEEAIEVALTGYRAHSDSVRQLVLVHSIRLISQQPDEAIVALLDPVILRAFDKEEAPIRAKLLRCFESHWNTTREQHLVRVFRQPGYKYRSIDERTTMLRVLAANPSEATVECMGAVLNQVRLFSSDTELQFQLAVAKALLEIDTPQSRLQVHRVLKAWTVPGRVKEEIKLLLKAQTGSRKGSS